MGGGGGIGLLVPGRFMGAGGSDPAVRGGDWWWEIGSPVVTLAVRGAVLWWCEEL